MELRTGMGFETRDGVQQRERGGRPLRAAGGLSARLRTKKRSSKAAKQNK